MAAPNTAKINMTPPNAPEPSEQCSTINNA